eukprot:m.433794 g.433794  ORF g.433794 m.433794 type:complete len:235 (+) comp17618_c0_seq1:878-1582(+)
MGYPETLSHHRGHCNHATHHKKTRMAKDKLTQLGSHAVRAVDTLRTLSIRYRASVADIMRLNKMSDASQFNYMRAVVVPKDRSSACSRGCVAITGKSHLACDCTAWKVQKWGTPQKTRSHYETEMPMMSALHYGSIQEEESVPVVTFSSVVIRAAPAVVIRSGPAKQAKKIRQPKVTTTSFSTTTATTAATTKGSAPATNEAAPPPSFDDETESSANFTNGTISWPGILWSRFC